MLNCEGMILCCTCIAKICVSISRTYSDRDSVYGSGHLIQFPLMAHLSGPVLRRNLISWPSTLGPFLGNLTSPQDVNTLPKRKRPVIGQRDSP